MIQVQSLQKIAGIVIQIFFFIALTLPHESFPNPYAKTCSL